jgi:tyrosinase
MSRRYPGTLIDGLAVSRSRRQVLGAAGRGAAGGVGLALIGRGLGNGLPGPGSAVAAWVGGALVDIRDFAYKPRRIDVPVGTEVTWTNRDYTAHTVTADDGISFDSGPLSTGQTFRHTFTTAGVFDYHCAIHPDMRGKVVVTAPRPTKHTRPNVHHLDPYGPELTAYADAVTAMKALPETNPVSWAYQANIHWTPFTPPPPDPLPEGWSTCEHGSLFFWPWHRMYLYWFERAVRQASGDETWALPYWDYSDPGQRILPEPFRDPASPLYVADRGPDVNGGLPPAAPPSIFDHCFGLAETQFDFASFGLEGTPHNDIHVWIGGLMGSVPTAARDPIFWLHHANIDRLWSSWLALGNANPLDPAWRDNAANSFNGRSYEFFDESGAQVTTIRVVNEVLDNVSQLGYDYEELADLAICPAFIASLPPAADTLAATPTAQIELGSATEPGGIELGAAPVSVPVTLSQAEAAGTGGASGTTVLTLEGVRGEGVPGVLFEIYVNLPEGAQPDASSPYYVGNLSLFALQPWDSDPGHQHVATKRFNISRNVVALTAIDEWTADFDVTFIPYQFAAEADAATPAAAVSGPWATIESVSVTSE